MDELNIDGKTKAIDPDEQELLNKFDEVGLKEDKQKAGRKKDTGKYAGVSRKDLIALLEEKNETQFKGIFTPEAIKMFSNIIFETAELAFKIPYTQLDENLKNVTVEAFFEMLDELIPTVDSKYAKAINFVTLVLVCSSQAFKLKIIMEIEKKKETSVSSMANEINNKENLDENNNQISKNSKMKIVM